MSKHRLVCIGYGSAGRPLIQALDTAGWDIKGIVIKTDLDKERALTDGYTTFSLKNFPLDIDLLIIAVPDLIISSVAEELQSIYSAQKVNRNIIAMHTAGRFCQEPLTPLLKLGWKRLAWHPLQSFTLDSTPESLTGIYAGVTADKEAEKMADLLCTDLNIKKMLLNSAERSSYHLSAVLASNFLPAIVQIALEEHPYGKSNPREALDSLLPLIDGMIKNLHVSLPEKAMSGPVNRNDYHAVAKQVSSIRNEKGREIYRLLTEYLVEMKLNSGMMSKEIAGKLLDALK